MPVNFSDNFWKKDCSNLFGALSYAFFLDFGSQSYYAYDVGSKEYFVSDASTFSYPEYNIKLVLQVKKLETPLMTRFAPSFWNIV